MIMADKEQHGYIYIFTNPSFPQYVKIGYADDVEQRLRQLNRSETIPFAFRCYATYEVNHRLTDMKIHDVIDKLNPDIRSIDNVNGKKRVREFFAMSKEDAYSILEAIAEINGLENNLKKWAISEEEKEAEELSEEINEEHSARLSPFRFSMVGIKIGEEIHSLEYPEVKAVVVDDKHVEYNGETISLSPLAKQILGWKGTPQGPLHFTYNGEILANMRARIEDEKRK